MIPQLARTTDDPSALIANDDWAMQQKFDGDRLLVEFTDANMVRGFSRRGNIVSLPKTFIPAPSEHRSVTLIDGELMDDGTYNVFDIPKFQGMNVGGLTFAQRQGILSRVVEAFKFSNICLVHTANTTAEKASMLTAIQNTNQEGVVFKHKESVYRFNNRSYQWQKYKLYKSCSVIITELNREGKPEAVTIGLNDGHELSGCKIPDRYQKSLNIQVGDIIEVKYLSLSEDFRLIQPTFLKKRTDLSTNDCSRNQFAS